MRDTHTREHTNRHLRRLKCGIAGNREIEKKRGKSEGVENVMNEKDTKRLKSHTHTHTHTHGR